MKFSLLILVLISSIRVYACDICGGVSGNATIGLFASTKYHMFGVKSGMQSFSSFMDGIVHSREYVQRNELNFRFQFHRRLQVMGIVPQQFAIQKRDLGSDYVQGFGDPMIMLNGIVLQKKDTNGRTIHFLSLGMGIKFPIGRVGSTNSAIKNLYPGTGALEELIILNYTRSFKRNWSLQNEVSYAIKQRNKEGYKYGNSSQLSISVVNNSKLGFRRIISSAGIVYSHFQPSYLNGEQLILNNNKGFVLASKAGIHLMGYNWLFSIQCQVPVYQNLNNRSIKQNFGIEAGLTYLLKTKIKKHEIKN
jgi:hypothetical protein